MKSVDELYANVSFEEAEKEIIRGIEDSLLNFTRTEVPIPESLSHVFLAEINKEKTQSFFNKLISLGYKISHSGYSLKIKFSKEDRLSLKKKERALLENLKALDVTDRTLDDLIDSNVVTKIIASLAENKNKWSVIRSDDNVYSLESSSVGSLHSELKMIIKYNVNNENNIEEAITVNFKRDYNNNYLLLSRKDCLRLQDVIIDLIEESNETLFESITNHLKEMSK